jgi:hypothetical protein
MGKDKSTVWQHYTTFHRENKLYGKCKFCDATFQQNATRMKQHLLTKCKYFPDDRKRSLGSEPQGEQSETPALEPEAREPQRNS